MNAKHSPHRRMTDSERDPYDDEREHPIDARQRAAFRPERSFGPVSGANRPIDDARYVAESSTDDPRCCMKTARTLRRLASAAAWSIRWPVPDFSGKTNLYLS